MTAMLETMMKSIPPLLLAATAGYLPFRAGALNIGLEGLMIVGAFAGFLASAATGSWLAGILAAAILAGAAAAIFAWTVQSLESNIFLSGLGLNLAAAGLVGIASQVGFGTKGVLRPEMIGDAAFPSPNSGAGLILAAGAFVLVAYLLRKSRAGHLLITAGEAEENLETFGASVKRIRFTALTLSGLGCGAAGALLSLDIGAYVPNMTGGRGWIALVALYIAAGRPAGLLGTVLLFAAAGAAAVSFQGISGIPDSLLLAAPFVITLAGLLASSALRSRLGKGRE